MTSLTMHNVEHKTYLKTGIIILSHSTDHMYKWHTIGQHHGVTLSLMYAYLLISLHVTPLLGESIHLTSSFLS